jgi:Uncharacterized protein conserved in bacteria
MAIELLDEHEQGEKVRKWLRDNSLGLVGGVALGIAIIGGWKWWQDHLYRQKLQAADAYQAFLDSIEAGDIGKAAAAAAGLADGAYAGLAALALAKAQLDAGKRDEAIATLQGAPGDDPVLAPVIRQRLARLLVDAGRGGEALALLDGVDDALSHEARGDALFALGRADEARGEYEATLRQLDVAAPHRRLLELKLAETGGKPETPEAQS